MASKRALYLHGFASSPQSRKATVLGSYLRDELGYSVEVPDLEEGAFERLTITGQLAVVGRHINRHVGGGPVVLVGSSLGGYLAALYAARHSRVERLILLAPAFDFHRLWTQELGPQRLAEWKRTNQLPVFHYGSGGTAMLGYALIADAARYEPFPDVSQPTLILHGTADPLVPISLSEHFAAQRPNRQMVPLSSGHELTDVLLPIWQHAKEFLMASKSPDEC